LQVFEPGAQGEHKLARGFLPTLTQSAHWIKDELFKTPIRDFCKTEQAHIADYRAQMQAHSPYKNSD
jgi:predicted N-acyltransferase